MYQIILKHGIASLIKYDELVFEIGMGNIINAEINNNESMLLITYENFSELRNLDGKLVRTITQTKSKDTIWVGNHIVVNNKILRKDLRKIDDFKPRIL